MFRNYAFTFVLTLYCTVQNFALAERFALNPPSLEARLGVNAVGILTARAGRSSNRIAPFYGLGANAKFSQTLRAYLVIDSLKRGAETNGGQIASARYFDILLGAEFELSEWFSSVAPQRLGFGPALFIPTGSLNLGTNVIQPTKNSLGLSIHIRQEFPVHEKVFVAVSLLARGSITDAFETSPLGTLQKIIDIGFLLSVGWH